MDSTKHDTDNPTIDTTENANIDENALEEAILKAEEFAAENETMLLQEGEGDFEEGPEKEEKPKKQGRKTKKQLPLEQNTTEEPAFDETSPETVHEESDLSENLPENITLGNEGSLVKNRQEPSSDTRYYMDEDGKYVEDISSPYRAQHQRLTSAFNRRDILSGNVEGFELNSIEIPRIFLYAGDIKVVIPLS